MEGIIIFGIFGTAFTGIIIIKIVLTRKWVKANQNKLAQKKENYSVDDHYDDSDITIEKAINNFKTKNGKNTITKDLINTPLIDGDLKKRIDLSENIRQLYNIGDDAGYFIEPEELDEDILTKIDNIQKLLMKQRNRNYSNAEILEFLINSMNFGKFQIWLMDCQFNGIKVSLNDKLKKFFEENSEEQILGLYDICQNFNNAEGLVEKYEIEEKQERDPVLKKLKQNKNFKGDF